MKEELNKRILKELQKQTKWQRLQGIKIVREIIPTLLDDEKKKKVYELTDGENTERGIAKSVGVGIGTISRWWNLWYSYGILIKENNRYQKIISLKELGIDIGEDEKSD